MSKTILITGGLGFVGKNLVNKLLLKTNYEIIIFDSAPKISKAFKLAPNSSNKKRLTFIKGDIRKSKELEKAIVLNPIVIHLAAKTNASESIKFPTQYINTNINGTLSVLKSCVKRDIRKVILLSSSEVYGDQINGIKMDEIHPTNPITPYAVSKLASEKLAYSFYLTKNLPVVIFRAFNIYGPFQYPEKMIPLSIVNLLKGRQITLSNGGKPKRDWIYVEDVVDAIMDVIKYEREDIYGQIFNIGTGKTTSIKKVAELIVKILHKKSSSLVIDPSRKIETSENVGISNKAKHVFNWKAKVSLEQGLKKTIKWYMQNYKNL